MSTCPATANLPGIAGTKTTMPSATMRSPGGIRNTSRPAVDLVLLAGLAPNAAVLDLGQP